MALRIHGVDTVVVGHFNPWIIQPSWLAAQGMLTADEVHVAFQPYSSSGLLQFRMGDYHWKVSQDRLIVHSDPMRNTARPILEIIQRLPHTPLVAIGNNFSYVTTVADWQAGTPSLGRISEGDLEQLGELVSQTWESELALRNAAVLKTTIRLDSTNVIINLNFNRITNTTEAARAALRNFDSDSEASRQFVTELLGETIENWDD